MEILSYTFGNIFGGLLEIGYWFKKSCVWKDSILLYYLFGYYLLSSLPYEEASVTLLNVVIPRQSTMLFPRNNQLKVSNFGNICCSLK